MTIPALHGSAIPGWPRRLLAVGAAVLVLMLGIVAASPQLHGWLHSDAGQADHECAVTLYVHGAILSFTEVILIGIAFLLAARRALNPATPDLAPCRYRLSPGRAPPAR